MVFRLSYHDHSQNALLLSRLSPCIRVAVRHMASRKVIRFAFGNWKPFILFLLVVLVLVFLDLVLQLKWEMNGNNSHLYGEFMKKVEKEMSRRRDVVAQVCAREEIGKYGTNRRAPGAISHPPTPHYESFYFDLKHQLIWCPVYKAASTSWLFNFCILSGLQESFLDTSRIQISNIARTFYPPLKFAEALKEASNESNLKFFIVRHPFDRLLSAYRDKLENIAEGKEHGTEFYYEKYGKKIVEKYRKQKRQNNTLIKYGDKENGGNTLELSSKQQSERLEPTFEEFVTYVTDTKPVYADEHWMPYYLYCTPCLLDYDVIAKFETLEEDQKYIILKANLQGQITPEWKHLTKGMETKSLAKKYFSTISKELLWKLYDQYRLDFELFEYNVDEHLSYVK